MQRLILTALIVTFVSSAFASDDRNLADLMVLATRGRFWGITGLEYSEGRATYKDASDTSKEKSMVGAFHMDLRYGITSRFQVALNYDNYWMGETEWRLGGENHHDYSRVGPRNWGGTVLYRVLEQPQAGFNFDVYATYAPHPYFMRSGFPTRVEDHARYEAGARLGKKMGSFQWSGEFTHIHYGANGSGKNPMANKERETEAYTTQTMRLNGQWAANESWSLRATGKAQHQSDQDGHTMNGGSDDTLQAFWGYGGEGAILWSVVPNIMVAEFGASYMAFQDTKLKVDGSADVKKSSSSVASGFINVRLQY